MNPLTTVSPTRLPRALGLVAAFTFALGGLTACSNTGNTTCGEFADQSDSERRDTVSDLIDEADDNDSKEQLQDLEGEERDAAFDIIAQGVVATCEEGGDDDKEIGDIVYEES